jgi:hypothetical protein
VDWYVCTSVSEVGVIALMMEAVQTSETLVDLYQFTRRYNPEDRRLQKMGKFIWFIQATLVSRGCEWRRMSKTLKTGEM